METEAIPFPMQGRYILNPMRIAFGSGPIAAWGWLSLFALLIFVLVYVGALLRRPRQDRRPSLAYGVIHAQFIFFFLTAGVNGIIGCFPMSFGPPNIWMWNLAVSQVLLSLVTETLVCLACVGVLALVCRKAPQPSGWGALGIVLVTTDTLLFLSTISTIWLLLWHI